MTASQKTFIERTGDSAIRVGRILVSAKALPDALARYSRLLFCLNNSGQHPYSLGGTATGLRWQNRCMLFWCSHQTIGYPPNDVVVPLDKDGKFPIFGSTFVHIVPALSRSDEEFYDLCGMHYIPECSRSFDRARRRRDAGGRGQFAAAVEASAHSKPRRAPRPCDTMTCCGRRAKG